MDARLQEQQPTEEEEKTIKPKLKIIQGGLAGAEPPDQFKTWLDGLEIGTLFYVQDKTVTDYVLHKFFLKTRTPKGNVELVTQGSTGPIEIPVKASRFCNKYDLEEILGVYNE